MSSLQKTVLIIQASERQEAIWSKALTSQGILVLQRLPDVDPYQLISQKDVKLPDLLLIDIGVHRLNPFNFCNSCRGHNLNTKIILTSGVKNQVTSAERRWAIFQGAQDLLPKFQSETLLDEGVAKVNRVLQVLDCLPLDRESLIPVLLPLTSSSTPQKVLFSQLDNSKLQTNIRISSTKPEPVDILETNRNILSPESKLTDTTENNKNPPLPESKPKVDNSTSTKRRGHSYRG